jgi:hypothetical protein
MNRITFQLFPPCHFAPKDLTISSMQQCSNAEERSVPLSPVHVTEKSPMQLAHCVAPPSNREEEPEGRDTHNLMLIWVTVAWLLFLTIFICEMTQHYATVQVGKGSSAVISDSQAADIFELCFAGVASSGQLEGRVGEAFAIGGSLYASLLGVALLWDAWVSIKYSTWRAKFWQPASRRRTARTLGVVGALFWGVPQIITIFQDRQVQISLADSLGLGGGNYSGSFGQIVAVVVFLPVPVEAVHQWCLGSSRW